MSSSPKRRPGLPTIVVVALLASLATTGVSTASHQFSDVSNGHPFHADINAIRTAGITGGYSDGTYRPEAPVSRGAMAAFMRRGFGRVASESASYPNPNDNVDTLGAFVSIRSGAAVGGTGGFVTVTGTAAMLTPVSECPCILTAWIYDHGTGVSGNPRTAMGDVENLFLTHIESVAFQATFPIPANATHYYSARFRVLTTGANSGVTVRSDIQATYVPFHGNP